MGHMGGTFPKAHPKKPHLHPPHPPPPPRKAWSQDSQGTEKGRDWPEVTKPGGAAW